MLTIYDTWLTLQNLPVPFDLRPLGQLQQARIGRVGWSSPTHQGPQDADLANIFSPPPPHLRQTLLHEEMPRYGIYSRGSFEVIILRDGENRSLGARSL